LTLEERRNMGKSDLSQTPVSLVVPCRAEYVRLCRLVAGVVGARESLDEEDIADMKLVVTEACTCFLGSPEESPSQERESRAAYVPCSLRVDYRVLADTWEITISDPDHCRRLPGSVVRCLSDDGGLGLTIMRALVDTVEIEHTDSEVEGSVIRLVKKLSPRSTEAL
jgi:anti-sigma regulatory factor (Ser/Thr protein kinase)